MVVLGWEAFSYERGTPVKSKQCAAQERRAGQQSASAELSGTAPLYHLEHSASAEPLVSHSPHALSPLSLSPLSLSPLSLSLSRSLTACPHRFKYLFMLCRGGVQAGGAALRDRRRGRCLARVQGYLTYEKPHPPRTLQ